MYCKICDKPIPPQFDLCFKHRQEKIAKLKDLLSYKCIQVLRDEARYKTCPIPLTVE